MAEDIQRITGTSAKIAARLCNFPTGQSHLLLAHIDFLDKEVATVIRSMQGPWVDLFGYASRVGDAGFNMSLSEQRVNTVKRHISEYANQVNFQIQKGIGETESGPEERNNSDYWRAVEVYVYAHKPTSPKSVLPVVAGATEFNIRVVGGLSVTFPALKGPQADGYMFQIIDVKNARAMFFSYTAMAIALPSLPGLPISFTGVGPLTKFSTSQPINLFQFEGPATLFQDPGGASFGPLSTPAKLRLSFDSKNILRAGARVIPSIVPMESGPGLQTLSTGSAPVAGVLVRQSKEIPFTG